MKYLKAIDPATGLVCVDRVWAAADDGTMTTVLNTDAGWLDYLKTSLPDQIDALVADVYTTWMRFQAEYEAREAAAQAFTDAGYAGDASVWVTGFATAAGLTTQAACERILAQSVSLRGALEQLGTLRMRKYEVLLAADMQAAQAAYDDIVAKIEQTAATIQ